MNYGEISGILSLQAVLAALAGWLGKIFAERIARQEVAELQAQINRLQARLQVSSRYELELNICRDVWEKLLQANSVIQTAPFLKPIKHSTEDTPRKSQLDLLQKVIGEVGAAIQTNRPFFAESVYQEIAPLSAVATEAFLRFQTNENTDEYTRWAAMNLHAIAAHCDALEKAIRDRMKQISI
jgi:cytochrome c556